jgi:N utilization substance protein A
VRLAARLTGWKIDIKNSLEYNQTSEDESVAVLISQRQEEETLQAEAEARLAAEQAIRAEEDARLRELYPLPEDEDEAQESADLAPITDVATSSDLPPDAAASETDTDKES